METGVPILGEYEQGTLTLRGLHYQLVAMGMTNDLRHYKKVVSAMIAARWDRTVPFDAFVDHDRETIGVTKFEQTDVASTLIKAKQQIRLWAQSYSKNRWENQLNYPEVFIEKKALQGVFEKPCDEWGVALNPCKGYPSITFLYDAAQRFIEAEAEGKTPVILYFGDYDCSGEDIPRSIGESLYKMGVQVEIQRIALMEDQVVEWDLPPAPTKSGDSRAANWDGIGQVELDAVKPAKIRELLQEALEDLLDRDLYDELMEQEDEEQTEFKDALKADFATLLD
jgi:hypothetical protein